MYRMLFVVAGGLLCAACSLETDHYGALGGPCYKDNTCNISTLTCVEGTCERAPAAQDATMDTAGSDAVNDQGIPDKGSLDKGSLDKGSPD